ncbi:YwqG family protein [Actinopolyspora sp. H202]|uniref:YwqG family protein n=1 Tax=Actinopolyspora sp. H202 TaxID=1500456 RepID=UPI003EE5B005
MSGTEQQRERVRQTLTEHVGAAEAERITALAATSVALSTHSEAGAPLGVSRFGGDALLPPDTTWPEHESRALELLAVLDLTALAPLNPELPLPHHGVLNFCYAPAEQLVTGLDPGESDGWRVIHADPATAVRTAPPGETKRHHERTLHGRPLLTVPDLEDLPPDEAGELPDKLLDGYRELRDDENEPAHRIGGWPDLIQGPVLENSGKELLLAQLDSDDRMDWCWGDSGSLYFLIEEQDLKAGDFSRVWLEMQCC